METKIRNPVDVKKKKSKTIPVGYVLIVAFMLVAVFLIWIFSLFNFPAKKYVKSALNAICYDETKEYMKLTNSSQDESDDSINDDLQLQAEAFAAYFGITDVSDKSMEMLIDFSKEVYTYSDFKVIRQKKKDDAYIVTVRVKPILFDDISKKEIKDYVKEFNQRAEDGEFLYDTDSVYQEKFLEGLLGAYRKQLKNIEYGKKTKIQVEVEQTSNKRYEADLTEVLNALISFE